MERKFNIDSLFRLILREKKVYAITIGLTTVFAIIVAFSLPKEYTSTVKIAPELSNGTGLDGLSTAASLIGANLKGLGDNNDAFLPDLYPEIIHSTGFLERLSKAKVISQDGILNVSLADYMMHHIKRPWWAIKLPFSKDKTNENKYKHSKYELSKAQIDLYREIENCTNLSIDNGTGLITINVTLQDPNIAAIVADSVSNMLQSFILNYRTNKSKMDLAYYEKLSRSSKKDYTKALQAYASYVDANTDVTLMTYKSKETELENEMQSKFDIFNQLEQRKAAARAKVQDRTPVFNVLQQAYAPVKKSGPKRVLIVLLYNVLAFCILTSYYLIKQKNNCK